MAFNIVARIDDLLYVDDLTKHSDRFPLAPMVNMVSQKKVSQQLIVSVSDTQHKAKFGTPSYSPVPLISPSKGEITPFIHNNNNNIIKPQRRGFGVKRVLSNYLGGEMKAAKIFSNSTHEVNSSNPSCKRTEQQESKNDSCPMKSKTK